MSTRYQNRTRTVLKPSISRFLNYTPNEVAQSLHLLSKVSDEFLCPIPNFSKLSLLVYAWSHESFDELFRFHYPLSIVRINIAKNLFVRAAKCTPGFFPYI